MAEFKGIFGYFENTCLPANRELSPEYREEPEEEPEEVEEEVD